MHIGIAVDVDANTWPESLHPMVSSQRLTGEGRTPCMMWSATRPRPLWKTPSCGATSEVVGGGRDLSGGGVSGAVGGGVGGGGGGEGCGDGVSGWCDVWRWFNR